MFTMAAEAVSVKKYSTAAEGRVFLGSSNHMVICEGNSRFFLCHDHCDDDDDECDDDDDDDDVDDDDQDDEDDDADEDDDGDDLAKGSM